MPNQVYRKRIADEVESLVAKNSETAKNCFIKQIKTFNGHMAEWHKVQQEIRDNPNSKSYYPNPMLWEIDDKLCCYYATLAVIHDAMKVKPPLQLSEGVDQGAAYILYRYSSKATCPYGDDGLDTALKYVKANIQSEAKEKTGQGETKTKSDGRQTITLQQFFKDHCDLSKRIDIESKREMLLREYRKKNIKLPLVGKKQNYRKGQTYLFYLDGLIDKWPTYRKALTTLPPLKKSGNK
jgi:hypothetical protein